MPVVHVTGVKVALSYPKIHVTGVKVTAVPPAIPKIHVTGVKVTATPGWNLRVMHDGQVRRARLVLYKNGTRHYPA